jgi:hypothetical protein
LRREDAVVVVDQHPSRSDASRFKRSEDARRAAPDHCHVCLHVEVLEITEVIVIFL